MFRHRRPDAPLLREEPIYDSDCLFFVWRGNGKIGQKVPVFGVERDAIGELRFLTWTSCGGWSTIRASDCKPIGVPTGKFLLVIPNEYGE